MSLPPDFQCLPGWNFTKLVGGPVLRATFEVLKKMIEDAGQDFPETFRPLLELADNAWLDLLFVTSANKIP